MCLRKLHCKQGTDCFGFVPRTQNGSQTAGKNFFDCKKAAFSSQVLCRNYHPIQVADKISKFVAEGNLLPFIFSCCSWFTFAGNRVSCSVINLLRPFWWLLFMLFILLRSVQIFVLLFIVTEDGIYIVGSIFVFCGYRRGFLCLFHLIAANIVYSTRHMGGLVGWVGLVLPVMRNRWAHSGLMRRGGTGQRTKVEMEPFQRYCWCVYAKTGLH